MVLSASFDGQAGPQPVETRSITGRTRLGSGASGRGVLTQNMRDSASSEIVTVPNRLVVATLALMADVSFLLCMESRALVIVAGRGGDCRLRGHILTARRRGGLSWPHGRAKFQTGQTPGSPA